MSARSPPETGEAPSQTPDSAPPPRQSESVFRQSGSRERSLRRTVDGSPAWLCIAQPRSSRIASPSAYSQLLPGCNTKTAQRGRDKPLQVFVLVGLTNLNTAKTAKTVLIRPREDAKRILPQNILVGSCPRIH